MKKNKQENKNGFKIEVKKKYFNFKADNIIMLIFTILIGMMSGIIASEFFVESAISGISSQASGNITIVEDEEFAVKKVFASLTTISSNKANLEYRGDKADNITGVVIDKNGYIITNYSKVRDFKDIYIKLTSISMDPKEGKLIGFDEAQDIALIKIDMEGLTAINRGQDEDLVEGKKVIAIGNAINDEYAGIVTPGIITSLNDTVYDERSKVFNRLIQTSALINEENTGGAIVNLKGELLGICSNKISTDKGKVGLFYGVGISEIDDIVNEIIGNVNILGVRGEAVTKEKDTDIQGFYVEGVEEDGIAAKAGIRALDIVFSIGGQEVGSVDEIYYALKDKSKTEAIDCIILRGGEEKKIKIHLS